MKMHIALSVSFVAMLFVPAATAAESSDILDAAPICLPPGGPVSGCVTYGVSNRAIYYYEAGVSSWVWTCAWVVCLQTPVPSVTSAYLTDAPVPYTTGTVCTGTKCATWDTRGILANIADVELLA